MREMTLAEKIEVCARRYDADIVAFGGADKLRGTEAFEIFPDVKSVIVLGFRVLRGSHLGIEEGSTFYQYSTTGLETIEETIIPGALLRVSAVIEDEGFLAVPQRKNQMLRPAPEALNPEMLNTYWYPAGEKEPQPDFTAAAILCGLGERGDSGALLTDRFGPFQRVALILTDAVFENCDQPVQPHLCDHCGACARACPGHALKDGEIDLPQCAAYYRGANMHYNPYMDAEAYPDIPNREAVMEGKADLSYEEALKVMEDTYFYPPMKHGYAASICGRACDRACYAHLEEKGVLTARFASPFRRRPVWELPMLKLK